MASHLLQEFDAMNIKHASLQPQDPVAARLGTYITRAGIALAAILFALSYLRG
jgi:hypothetical protein